jgi:hypothetical protein
MAWASGLVFRLLNLVTFTLNMTAFWDVAPCSLADVGGRFRGSYCLHNNALFMEARGTSEPSVYFNETTRRYIPESCRFHTRHLENLDSHTLALFLRN